MLKRGVRNWHVYDVNCDCAAYTWAWMRPVASGKFRRCIYCGRQLGDMQLSRYRLVRAKTQQEAMQKAHDISAQTDQLLDEIDLIWHGGG
jgi:hypothetical protein